MSDLIAFMINRYNAEARSALPNAPVIEDGYRKRRGRPLRGLLAATLSTAASAACRWADRLDPNRAGPASSPRPSWE